MAAARLLALQQQFLELHRVVQLRVSLHRFLAFTGRGHSTDRTGNVLLSIEAMKTETATTPKEMGGSPKLSSESATKSM